MGLPPQLKLLVLICKSGHGNMSEQCNNICPYSKDEHTQFHSGVDTHKAYVGLMLKRGRGKRSILISESILSPINLLTMICYIIHKIVQFPLIRSSVEVLHRLIPADSTVQHTTGT